MSKDQSYTLKIMIEEAIEDALYSDMLAIKAIQIQPKKDQLIELSDTFFLSEKLARDVINNDLFIAIFEAASVVNHKCNSHSEITTLRRICETQKDHPILQDKIEKYLLYIELFALNFNPHKHMEILKKLTTARRSAYAIKEILDPQIKNKELENSKNNRNYSVQTKRYLLKTCLENIEKYRASIPHHTKYADIWLLVVIAKTTGLAINKFTADDINAIRKLTLQRA